MNADTACTGTMVREASSEPRNTPVLQMRRASSSLWSVQNGSTSTCMDEKSSTAIRGHDKHVTRSDIGKIQPKAI